MPRDGEHAPVQVAMIGMSFTMNLGGDRQVVVQTGIDPAAHDDQIDALLDRIFRAGDRQKAKYELEGLREDLMKHERTLAQFTEDRARLDLEHDTAQAKRTVELEQIQADMKAVHDDAYDKHLATGRQGKFEPKGAVASRLRAGTAAFAKQREEIERAEAERKEHLRNLDISEQRYHEEIARLSGEIAKRVRLLG